MQIEIPDKELKNLVKTRLDLVLTDNTINYVEKQLEKELKKLDPLVKSLIQKEIKKNLPAIVKSFLRDIELGYN